MRVADFPVLLFALASFGLPLGLGLAMGRGRRRQLALAVVVLVIWWSWAVYVHQTCPVDAQCAASVVFFALFGLISLAGACAATLVRADVDRGRLGRRTVAVTPMAVLLVASGAGYMRSADEITRWGCPTTADFVTPWSVDEVVDVFEDAGLPLEPAALLPALYRPSGGAQAFQHRVPGAALDVVVCRARCLPFYIRPGRSAERPYAGFFREGFPNVIVVVTELDDRRAANQLRREINRPMRELVLRSPAFYPSRCGAGR